MIINSTSHLINTRHQIETPTQQQTTHFFLLIFNHKEPLRVRPEETFALSPASHSGNCIWSSKKVQKERNNQHVIKERDGTKHQIKGVSNNAH